MVGTKIKALSDCTDSQKNFIAALTSHEILSVPRAKRWRWAALQAGYSENTAISLIIGPIKHLLEEVAKLNLSRAAIEATWQLSDAVGDGEIDAATKDRLSAAKDILDRTVPKRVEKTAADAAPAAVVILPVKAGEQVQIIQKAEVRELNKIEDVSSS